MARSWWKKLLPGRAPAPAGRPHARPRLTALEDRTTPATSIAILPSGGAVDFPEGIADNPAVGGIVQLDPIAFTNGTGFTGTLGASGNIDFGISAPVDVSGLTLPGGFLIQSTGGVVSFNSSLNVGANDLTIEATDVNLAGGPGPFLAGTGTLDLRPNSTSAPVTVANSGAGFLLTSADTGLIGNTFAAVNIGRNDSSAIVNADTGVALPTNSFLLSGAVNGQITLSGTIANETLVVDEQTGGTFYTLGANPRVGIAAGVFQFLGGGGDDVFVLSYTGGAPAVGTLNFDGGVGGNDSLRIDGRGTYSADYTPVGTGGGTIGLQVGGATANVIGFTNLEPVDMEDMVAVTVIGSAGADTFTVANGVTTLGNAAVVVSGAFGGVPFEQANLRNVIDLIIQGGAGNDTFAVNADGSTAANVGGLSIVGDADADTVTFSTTTFPGSLSAVAETITVNASSAITSNGNIGLTVDTALNLGNATITSNAGQTGVFGAGPIILSGDATVVGFTGVAFQGTINSAAGQNKALTVQATGPGATALFTSAVGATQRLSSLDVLGVGGIQLAGASYKTTGSQNYQNSAVVSAPAVAFDSSGGGSIIFQGLLDGTTAGGTAASFLADADVTFLGSVGALSPLASVLVDGSTAGSAANVAFGIAISLVVNTTGSQTYDATAAVLRLDATFASSAGGDIGFFGTLDGDAAGYDVVVNTGGNTKFFGAVGASFALSSLATDAGGSTFVTGGIVRTTGAQTFNDAVRPVGITLFESTGGGNIAFTSSVDGGAVNVNTAGTTAFAGPVGQVIRLTSLTTDGAGNTSVGANVGTTGAIIFNDGVTLTGDAVFSTTGGIGAEVRFNSTLNGAFTATVSTGDPTTFVGNVGGVTPLAGLVTNGGGTTQFDGTIVRTTGTQSYSDAVTITAISPVLFQSSGNVAFLGALDGGAPDTNVLIVNAAGTTTFNGGVGATNRLKSLTTDAAGNTVVGGDVTTQLAQTFNDGVTLGANVVFTATDLAGGAITFAGTLAGPFDVTVATNAATTFAAPVDVASLTTSAGGTTALNAANVRTTGAQTYGDPVTLPAAPVFLQSTAGGDITFNTTLDGAATLSIETGGKVVFGSTVGGVTPLDQVLTFGPGGAGPTGGNVLGGNVTTVRGQGYNGPTTLTASVTLTGGQDIEFDGTLDGISPGIFGITLNGQSRFVGSVGASGALAFIATDAGGFTGVSSPVVRTTGNQTYGDNVVVIGAGGVTFESLGGDISFAAGQLTSQTPGETAVTVTSGGVTTFGDVGGFQALASLTVNGGGTTQINGNEVTTAGAQTFLDPVAIGGGFTVAFSATAGDITFGGTLDGPGGAIVNTPGRTVFAANVGGVATLASLSVDNPGTSRFDGTSIQTAGDLAIGDALTLGATGTVTFTAGGQLLFGGTVDAATPDAVRLQLNGTGLTTLGGAVGATGRLLSLSTDAFGGVALRGPIVSTLEGQTYQEAATLTGDVILQTGGDPNTANVAFFTTVDGAFGLTVNAAGLTTFGGDVGGTTPLGSLTTDAAGSTALQGGRVVATNGQTYGDAVSINGTGPLLLQSSGAVRFGSTLDGARDLSVSAASVLLNGAVGEEAPLASLGVTAVTIDVRGGAATAGGQTYAGATTLLADSVFVSSGGGEIAFFGGLTGLFAADARTAGVTRFNGAVDVRNLLTDAPGSTAFGTGSVTAIILVLLDPATASGNLDLSAGLFGINTLAGPGGAARLRIAPRNGGDVTLGPDVILGLSISAAEIAGISGFGSVIVGGPNAGTITVDASANLPGGVYTLEAPGGSVVVGGTAGDDTLTLAGGGYALNGVAVSYVSPSFTFSATQGGVDTLAVDLASADTAATAVSLVGTGDDRVRLAGRPSLEATVEGDGGPVRVTQGGATRLTVSLPNADLTRVQSVDLVGFGTASAATNVGNMSLATGALATSADAALVFVNGSFGLRVAFRGNGSVRVTSPGTVAVDAATADPGNGNLTVEAGLVQLFNAALPAGGAFTARGRTRYDGGAALTAAGDLTFDGDLEAAALTVTTPGAFTVTRATTATGGLAVNATGATTLGGPVTVGGAFSTGGGGATVLAGNLVRAAGSVRFDDSVSVTASTLSIESDSVTSIVLNGPFNAGTSDVTLQADSVSINAPVTGTNRLTIRPKSITRPITVGGTADENFALTQAELDLIADTFNSVVIGRADLVAQFVLVDGTLLPLNTTLLPGPATAPPTAPPVVTQRLYAAGAGAGGGPRIQVFTPDGLLKYDFFAFDSEFRGGVRVAVGDVTGDGVDDIVAGSGVGGGPEVRIFSGATGELVRSFAAYDMTMRTGLHVAAADVDGDGFADVVTGVGSGGGPNVRVFSGKDGSLLSSFFAYDPLFRGGVRVAAADLDGDGKAEVITIAGPSGGPQVNVYSGAALLSPSLAAQPAPLASFFAFDASYRGGGFVSVVYVDGKPFVVASADSFREFAGTTLEIDAAALPDINGRPGLLTTDNTSLADDIIPTVYLFDAAALPGAGAPPTPTFAFDVPTGAINSGLRVSGGTYNDLNGVFVGTGPVAGGRVRFYPLAAGAAKPAILDAALFGADTLTSVFVGANPAAGVRR